MACTSHGTISGFVAGMSTVVFFPLEMLRNHLIVSDGHSQNHLPKYRNTFDAFRHIWQSRGIGGLYKGCYFHIINGFAYSTYFTLYASARIRHRHMEEKHKELYKFL
jgi:hypothetical protein